MIDQVLADQNVQNVVLGIVANILTSLLSMSARGARALVSDTTSLTAPNSEALLKAAIEEAAKKFEWSGPAKLEEVCLFVLSPEAANIIQQTFSAKLLDRENEPVEEIEQVFLACLAHFVDVSPETIEREGRMLFKAILSACDRALQQAIDEGSLPAHELRSMLRFSILTEQLAGIGKNLLLLADQRTPTKDIIGFEAKYRNQVGSRHAHIQPPDLDAQRRVRIDDLYVAPHLIRLARHKDEESSLVSLEDLRRILKRAVLLGNPGGGKSTLAQKFVHDSTLRTPGDGGLTPILVILRDYGAAKKENGSSLLQFIEMTSNANYQVPAPKSAFEYLLLNGRAFIIFDGLDELLDTSHRQEIARDIESFCNLFPSSKVLVTSRQVGYEQAPLDTEKFDTFVLEPFNEDQVREYVGKWFSLDRDLTTEQQKGKASSFFSESRIVADLCANPLMLALMCNIYRGENYIPTNRPDVYEKCALMLFDRWDKGRGIRVSLPIDAHIRPAMMYLAHWIYADEALQSGVTERKLVAKTTEYLCPKRFEDEEEAAAAARDFIEYCRGRAWVFTDTGTTRDGERLYQFTHRTFLEYFTAAQLIRVNPTPERLLPVLLPRISKREWDVVAQLAFQIQNKNVEGAGDELLNRLKEVAASNMADPWSYLSFAARCLEFIIPTPRTCREISLLSLDLFLRQPHSPGKPASGSGINEPRETIAALMTAASENQKVINAALEANLIERINTGEEKEAVKAAEVALHITICLHTRRRRTARTGGSDWRQFAKRILQSCAGRLKDLSVRDFRLAIDAFWRGLWPISHVLENHSVRAFFKRFPIRAFPDLHALPVTESLLMSLLYPVMREQDWDRKTTLIQIGEALVNAEKPIVRGTKLALGSVNRRFSRPDVSELEPGLENDEWFPLFALLAPYIESEGAKWRQQTGTVSRFAQMVFEYLRLLFDLRFVDASEVEVRGAVAKFPFNERQQRFAIEWCLRRMNLVEAKRRSPNGRTVVAPAAVAMQPET